MSGKIIQNVSVANCYQRNRQFCTQYQRAFPPLNMWNLLPFQGGKLAWTDISAMHLHFLSRTDCVNRVTVYCNAIAAAFAAWLLDKKKPDVSRHLRVSIGHDSRISSQKLQDAVSGGIAGAGLDVVQYGLVYTPAMFNSTITEDDKLLCPVDGSIVITASHLPSNRNGFKFFINNGGLGKADIKDILECAANIYTHFTSESLKDAERKASSSVKRVDYMAVYTSHLVDAVHKAAGNIEKPLEGFHIVVDAGNGAGGFFAAKVLEPLGAVTSGSQFLEPDGLFPNHIPNPEDKAAMKAIAQAVLDNKADLGIIFDTDVDRSAAVDSTGREFNRNRLIALMSAIHPGTTIVTDSVTSDGLTTFIEGKLGGKHHRFKRGYKNVIDEAIRLVLIIITTRIAIVLILIFIAVNCYPMALFKNSIGEESHLAIETSGYGALKENHWLDDGAYLMVKLLNKLASARASGLGGGSKVLTDLVEGLEEPAVAIELRLKIDQSHPDLKGGSFWEYGEAVLKHLENITDSDPKLQQAPVNYEGRNPHVKDSMLLSMPFCSSNCPHLSISFTKYVGRYSSTVSLLSNCTGCVAKMTAKLAAKANKTVRASGYGGWFLLRLSLHDPVLPLNIEAPSHEDAVKLGLAVLAAVNEFPALETSALDKFVKVL
ncbi:phosphoglucosamine mutase family protein [Actinidia rufa]|uniref:Phosphoglucosamine mutase family protein n=1 Tax=Actinidia rufa TaxID=165716 RepID=A0A7J0D9N4_9ERIC|nr:phosphoglucosamine mutase family protein [Actinidia rufa]